MGKIKTFLKDFKVGEHPKYFPKHIGKIEQLKSNDVKKLSVKKISSEEEEKRGKFNQDIIKSIPSINRKFSVQKP